MPEHETLMLWLDHYGSITLFVLLALGIIALPVPEETLMMIAGALMGSGHLSIPYTILAAMLGSMCGITCSYFIGRTAGHYFIHKTAPLLGISEEHLAKAHVWVEKFGKWALTIGYFIPGVRHFTGVVVGMTDLGFHEFAIFAYSGAIMWVSLFLSIGFFFGDYWSSIFENIEISVEEVLLITFLAIAAYVVFMMIRRKRKNFYNP